MRLGAGAVAFFAGAALVLAATPAQAEPAGADVEFKVLGDKVVRLASKPFYVQAFNKGPATAENVVVKVDLGGLDTDKLQVEPPVGCLEDGTVFTCKDIGNLLPGEHNNAFSPLMITALEVEGAQSGPAGSFTVEVTSDTPDPNPDNNKTTTVPIEIVPVGYDLVAYVEDVWIRPAAADDSNRERVKPGAIVPLTFFFFNHGTATAKGIMFKVSLPPFVTFAAGEKLDACRYNAKNNEATCEFPDDAVPPDRLFSLDEKKTPMMVEVAKDAPGPVALTGGIVDGGGLRRSTEPPPSTATLANAAAARGVVIAAPNSEQRRKIEADPEDNVAGFSVHTATNPADLAVTAGSGSGAVGATVQITITVKNNGPASSPGTTLVVTAPTGTELVGLPTGCQFETAGKVGKCKGLLAANGEITDKFAFKILSSPVGSDGKAVVSGTLDDPVEANNTAAITITISGGLPITGTKVSVIGGVGLAVLTAGVVLFLVARRRRVVLVTPEQDA